MKDQVTSIEQSRRLLELGVPAEKASMIYQSHYTQGVPKLYAQPYQRNGYPPKEKYEKMLSRPSRSRTCWGCCRKR